MHSPEDILIPIVFLTATAAVLISWMITRHRERISMIQKGLSSDEIKALTQREARLPARHNPLGSLKWGILLLLAGLALMAGNVLHLYYSIDEGIIFGLLFLFIGIGLIIFYGIASRKQSQLPQ